ncbi:MAG: D-aminoacylase [Ignavibacteriae bacterium]|nr:D-aminoacylase [Ignavibacteriota bacterium]
MRVSQQIICILSLALIAFSCQPAPDSYDILITNGRVVDGTGNPWYRADVGIRGDKIVAIGKLGAERAKHIINAEGKMVSPGFIDMLGQSELTLFIDNRAMSKISQGITTEITGEGESPAPVNERILSEWKPFLDKYNLNVDWTDFEGYFRRLKAHKATINIGVFVGATQLREYVIGFDNREPTAEELQQMKDLVDQAMHQGALGLSTSLVYAPAVYAKTAELIELAKVAAEHGGIYISHVRDEGDKLVQSVLEAGDIGREAKLPVHIWHLKVSGKRNWGKMLDILKLIESHRKQGIDMTADLYSYTAGATGLSATMPGWALEGGSKKLLERLQDEIDRGTIRAQLQSDKFDRQNFYRDSGPEGVLISSVYDPALKKYEGKRLSEIAKDEKKDPIDVLFELLEADSARTGAIYFMMGENDVRLALAHSWTSFNTDYNGVATDGPLSTAKPHPRTYGSFARILGKYVREEGVMTMEEAIRKMTSLAASRVGLKDRGVLKPGFYADVVVFDPATVTDKATFEEPHQYSEGIEVVLVNGQPVWESKAFTGNLPGMVLRGPGYIR